MKICIYGAGAIGAFMGAKLAAAGGHDVTAVARGPTLDALRTHGWRVRSKGTMLSAPAVATDDPSSLGVQDLVIVAVKGPALASVAERLGPLLGPNTIVMPAMNGVPWWFLDGVSGVDASPLESVDEGGRIGSLIDTSRVVGCVVHISTSTPEPGLVEHKIGDGLIIGEPLGGESDRVRALKQILDRAGFVTTASANVRQAVWYKLWGNMTMNPVSAFTGATIDLILADPLVLEFCSAAMREAADIGARIGCVIEDTPEDRHVLTSALGAFRSSMLQDVEAGRQIELDALVTVVCEIAGRVDVATPNINALLGLTRLFGRVHGLYPLAGASASVGG